MIMVTLSAFAMSITFDVLFVCIATMDYLTFGETQLLQAYRPDIQIIWSHREGPLSYYLNNVKKL